MCSGGESIGYLVLLQVFFAFPEAQATFFSATVSPLTPFQRYQPLCSIVQTLKLLQAPEGRKKYLKRAKQCRGVVDSPVQLCPGLHGPTLPRLVTCDHRSPGYPASPLWIHTDSLLSAVRWGFLCCSVELAEFIQKADNKLSHFLLSLAKTA